MCFQSMLVYDSVGLSNIRLLSMSNSDNPGPQLPFVSKLRLTRSLLSQNNWFSNTQQWCTTSDSLHYCSNENAPWIYRWHSEIENVLLPSPFFGGISLSLAGRIFIPSSFLLPNRFDLIPHFHGLHIQQHLRCRFALLVLLDHQTLCFITSDATCWRFLQGTPTMGPPSHKLPIQFPTLQGILYGSGMGSLCEWDPPTIRGSLEFP